MPAVEPAPRGRLGKTTVRDVAAARFGTVVQKGEAPGPASGGLAVGHEAPVLPYRGLARSSGRQSQPRGSDV